MDSFELPDDDQILINPRKISRLESPAIPMQFAIRFQIIPPTHLQFTFENVPQVHLKPVAAALRQIADQLDEASED